MPPQYTTIFTLNKCSEGHRSQRKENYEVIEEVNPDFWLKMEKWRETQTGSLQPKAPRLVRHQITTSAASLNCRVT